MTVSRVGRPVAPFKHADRLFIDGQWIPPSSGSRITVVSPTTEEVYVDVAEANEADVNRAVAAARKAFDDGPWPRISHEDRAKFLKAMAKALQARADDIAAIWPSEMGILHSMATAYSGAVSSVYQFYAGLAGKFPFEEERRNFAGVELGLLVREPVGVVGAIIPWNGPIMLIAYKVAPALLAGCTVVIKAAPEAPGHALIMAEVAEEIGLPPGVLNVVTADRMASEALVRNRDVDKIAFTGSSAVGKQIATIMGSRIGRYTLELGGKSAAVILDDFDMESAARSLAGAACDMTGQVCAALTRVIVPRKRHDEVVDALSAAFSSVKVGDPFDSDTQMGPLAMRRQRDRVERYIAQACDDGFKLATGGGRPRHLNRGFFIEPTVFGNVDNKSRLAQEEVFGPVLAVIPADSESHAIDLANDTVYGLNGAVFTHDPDRAYSVARKLRSGTVGHNGFRIDFSIAFGGFKESGVGREGGVEGLYPYLESKTVLLEGRPAHLRA